MPIAEIPVPERTDKPLFTPGPLTTSLAVKQAMLHDLGSRDHHFIETVQRLRDRLLALAHTSQTDGYEAILMQGSGTFGLEAVVSSTIAPDGRLLLLINGAYGERVLHMAQRLGINTAVLRFAEDTPPDPEHVARLLEQDGTITHVGMVHCETTTGILNPLHEIGAVVKGAGRYYFVDAMSSFGAIDTNIAEAGIDFLVTSANKCLEGVPGFSIILAKRDALLATEGHARTLSLDLHAQWRGLEKNGQFRFTPPTHTMLALHEALDALDAEEGVLGRGERYASNHNVLMQGMRGLGFTSFLPEALQSYIITSFYYPQDPAFSFSDFYDRLNEKGFVIYPGKLTQADCFRIGSIGQLFPSDMEALLEAVAETLDEMGIAHPRATTAS